MNILVIDTATAIELVAIGTPGGVYSRVQPMEISHARSIFTNMEAVRAEAGISMKDIDIAGVGIGPGSFTGIRIAVTTARMIAQLLGIPLVGIHSPLLYAASVPAGPGTTIMIGFDAKKKRVFGALYRKTGNESTPETLAPPGDYDPVDLAARIPPGIPVCAAGDGVERYRDLFHQAVPGISIHDGFLPGAPEAVSMVRIAYGKSHQDKKNYSLVVPEYARKSDAEIVMTRSLERDGGIYGPGNRDR